jgi:hypothetical protein
MKFMNINISKRNICIFIALCAVIFIASSLGVVREGFDDANKKNKNINMNKKNMDEELDTDTDTGSDTGTGNIMNEYGSYTAPAGNTVLFDMQDLTKSCNRKPKKNKNKNKNNNIYDEDDVSISNNNQMDEDLYMLKSEIVPPVCPACPNVTVCSKCGGKPAPPCPPCARCPEPAFECKKVPNYTSNNTEYLPRPVLTDFSQFGM